jgi:DNA-binding transcriptional MerR regulator
MSLQRRTTRPLIPMEQDERVDGPDIGALLQGRPAAPADPRRLLTIGEFGRRARLSARALRLYDRMGILVPDQVDPASGYRRYAEPQLGTARLVAWLRRLDMPLGDVARIIAAAPDDRAALVEAYWRDVETRIAFQRELAQHVTTRLSGATSGPAPAIGQRPVPEQLVLTEQRAVRVPELGPWLGMAFARLAAAAGRHGGIAGHPFAIYHGEVNVDSDGPVEVCVPIVAAEAPPGARLEPAHDEVFVRVRRAQVEYPQILSAFDAVQQWADEHGVPPAGPPREVYLADFLAAAPDDEVCDVALPVSPAP